MVDQLLISGLAKGGGGGGVAADKALHDYTNAMETKHYTSLQ